MTLCFWRLKTTILFLCVAFFQSPVRSFGQGQDLAANAALARKAFNCCARYLEAWSARIDPKSGLLRQGIAPDDNRWTPENSAADNFPFMLITAHFLRPSLELTLFRNALRGEKELTIQQYGLPTEYNLDLGLKESRDIGRLIFGASEYAKDGIVAMLEILGPGVWSGRMEELVEGIFEAAPVASGFGRLPSTDAEVNGEMLQVLCRLYWMTGRERYLEWARRIGDAYCYEVLPGNYGVPAHFWDFAGHTGDGRLKLRDHGCEIVSGLTLLYAIEKENAAPRAAAYYPAVKGMLDRIQEIGVDSSGLPYNEVDARTGEIARDNLSDCWGYDYYAYYTFYLASGEDKYKRFVERALSNLHRFRDYRWEPRESGESQDGIADAVEGALGLLCHLPVESAFGWVEHEIQRMLAFQREDGIIEGWWGDGNFARTALMYAFYKTQGVYCRPWREDLELASAKTEGGLEVYLRAGRPWEGELCFDPPRHKSFLGMRQDYPRINAFPEWYTVEPLGSYLIEEPGGGRKKVFGNDLIRGFGVKMKGGRTGRFILRREKP